MKDLLDNRDVIFAADSIRMMYLYIPCSSTAIHRNLHIDYRPPVQL